MQASRSPRWSSPAIATLGDSPNMLLNTRERWAVSAKPASIAAVRTSSRFPALQKKRNLKANRDGWRPIQPAVSGDAELSALAFTGRRELLGRQILSQIRRFVERADLDPARA
jgi:hypothetical protein